MMGDTYILDEFPLLDKYINYLQGKEFSLSPDEKEEFLQMCDFFGHDVKKYYMYDVEIIPMKMHDDWVRDNLYKLELWKDPFYDLMEIPIVGDRVQETLDKVKLVDGSYIAGGAAMYMAGWIDVHKDIDIFFTNKNALSEILLLECKSISDEFGHSFYVSKNAVDISYHVQGILRLYKAPTEIVHGFDVDCCGILYDHLSGKLWATKRAYWSFKNKMNIFDPERASPSYIPRLVKYMRRGYDIFVPFFTQLKIDEDAVQKWKDKVKEQYFENISHDIVVIDEDDIGKFTSLPDKYKKVDVYSAYDEPVYVPLPDKYYVLFDEKYKNRIFIRDFELEGMSLIDLSYPWGQMVRYIGEPYNSSTNESNQDILFLAKVLHVYGSRRSLKLSDYESDLGDKFRRLSNDELSEREVDELLPKFTCKNDVLHSPEIKWKEQNPMEQVTSTFNPQPIPDLKEWLRESQFFM